VFLLAGEQPGRLKAFVTLPYLRAGLKLVKVRAGADPGVVTGNSHLPRNIDWKTLESVFLDLHNTRWSNLPLCWMVACRGN